MDLAKIPEIHFLRKILRTSHFSWGINKNIKSDLIFVPGSCYDIGYRYLLCGKTQFENNLDSENYAE